jgi:hypothetical protein
VDTQTKFQAMLLPEGVQYDLATGIFRTSKISEFYRLASIQKGAEAPDVSTVVTLISENWNLIREEILRWYNVLVGGQGYASIPNAM